MGVRILAVAAGLACIAAGTEISGTVTDASTGVVPGVNVTAKNEATGFERTAATDNGGRYLIAQLPPGDYELTARKDGFQTEVRRHVALAVGANIALDLTLTVGAVTAETVVVATAELIDTRSAALTATMDPHSIRRLPLNGRDFAQLAMLEPGVAPSRRTSDSGGPGTKLVLGGNRPNQVSFVLDGSDINDANNNTPGSAAGVMLGVDTLREFRVLTNSYSAEYGRSAGGVISAITKTGSNAPHGSLFEFVRNSAFDAKNFFDSAADPIPAFRRNQFGAEVDGPVMRDRTFFMASYEELHQRLGVTSRTVVPDANARSAATPAVAPYLNLVPLPNERNFGDGTGEYVSASSQATDENFATARVDHRISAATSMFTRYTYDQATVAIPDGLRLVQADTTTANRYFTTEVTHLFTTRLLNTSRFSYNQANNDGGNTYLRPVDPALSFLPGKPLGQISVTGLFSVGPSRFGPSFSHLSLFQFTDDASYTRGRHSLKFGADHRFYRLPTTRPQSPYGFYQFNGLTDFLQARPSAVELTLPSSTLERDWRQSMTAAYVQDEIRLTRRLTANLGVRYERVTVPREANGLSASLRDPLHDTATTGGRLFENPSGLNFAPRAGVAWDPFGTGKTSIRSGFGIYYDPVWIDFYANAGNRLPPYYTLGSIRSPVFPRTDQSQGSAAAFVLGRLDVLEYQPRNPYTMQWNFSIQQQFGAASALTVSYSAQRGIHLARFVDENQALPQILPDGRKFFPVSSTVRNPAFTGIRYKVTDGQSAYNSLLLSFEQRAARGLTWRMSYAFSRNIDDGSVTVTQGGDNDLPQDPDSRKAERGLSNYDVRHYFVSHLSWDVPTLPGPRWLGRGWQMNSIATLAAGNPFSVLVGFDRARARFQAGTSPQRPDLATGRSNNPILSGPDRYFDPTAFALPEAGFFGNLGRNTLIGPGLAAVDLSLNKSFRVRERVTVQLRREIFNALNHPNFAIPAQRTVFSSSGAVGSAGRITSTATAARQVQVGMKVTF